MIVGLLWRKILPDFSALVLETPRERVVFALAALGICEEIVVRAWLLDALHRTTGLAGSGGGVAIWFMPRLRALGLILCGLNVASGTLPAPIVIHTLIDL